MLSNRLDTAYDYAAAHPDTVLVVSGGQGDGESVTEASAMAGYLIRRGIPRELQEDALNAMPVSDAKIDRFIASRLRDPEDRDEVRKLTAALYRRGFSGEEIRSALARFHADCEE